MKEFDQFDIPNNPPDTDRDKSAPGLTHIGGLAMHMSASAADNQRPGSEALTWDGRLAEESEQPLAAQERADAATDRQEAPPWMIHTSEEIEAAVKDLHTRLFEAAAKPMYCPEGSEPAYTCFTTSWTAEAGDIRLDVQKSTFDEPPTLEGLAAGDFEVWAFAGQHTSTEQKVGFFDARADTDGNLEFLLSKRSPITPDIRMDSGHVEASISAIRAFLAGDAPVLERTDIKRAGMLDGNPEVLATERVSQITGEPARKVYSQVSVTPNNHNYDKKFRFTARIMGEGGDVDVQCFDRDEYRPSDPRTRELPVTKQRLEKVVGHAEAVLAKLDEYHQAYLARQAEQAPLDGQA